MSFEVIKHFQICITNSTVHSPVGQLIAAPPQRLCFLPTALGNFN